MAASNFSKLPNFWSRRRRATCGKSLHHQRHVLHAETRRRALQVSTACSSTLCRRVHVETAPSNVFLFHPWRRKLSEYGKARPRLSNCELTATVGDRVLLKWIQGKQTKQKLTHSLREDGETIVDNHKIRHHELLGRPSHVRLHKESPDKLRRLSVLARHASIDEFTALSPRRVAPIYASYASSIVSLLDINNDPPSPDNDPTTTDVEPFQILEAGTGQGSLTMHLAKAVAASNPPVSRDIIPLASAKAMYRAGEEVDDPVDGPVSEALQAWRDRRRAIVHTVDVDPKNRVLAEQLIKSYRGGVYWPHIDFNVGNVKDWVAARRATAFVDVVLLDMPSVEDYISTVTPAMKDQARLLVFVPQITQIAACVQEIALQNLGLKLDTVLELGEGVSTGRRWDVRMATVRNPKAPIIAEPNSEEEQHAVSTATTIPPMVCRPIVGEMTRGGGFIATWKKTL